MPSNWLYVDTNFPTFTGEESPDEKITTILNYMFMLVEQLRYTLHNLDLSNMNSTAVEQYGTDLSEQVCSLLEGENGSITALQQTALSMQQTYLALQKLVAALTDRMDDAEDEIVAAKTMISNTVITNELYSGYGGIADLTVDKLRTDYKRARLYLAGDTSPLDYIRIHDEVIEFVTASTDGSAIEQMHDDGRYFYWLDAEHTQMTSTEPTEWPVYTYVYTELVKGSFCFDAAGDGTKIPMIKLGAGTDATGVNGVAVMKKLTDGLSIQYTTSAGTGIGIKLLDTGVVQINGPLVASGVVQVDGSLVVSAGNYGKAEPTGTPVDGQLYFQIVE